MDVGELTRRLQEPPRQHCHAAVLAALLDGANGPCLLLEERAAGLRSQPGEVCLPGGHLEAGETPTRAALREAREETGLDPAAVELLGRLPTQVAPTGYRVRPVVGRVRGVTLADLTPSPAEVACLFTVPLAFLEATPPETYDYTMLPTDTDRLPPFLRENLQARPRKLTTRVWQYEGHIIWGLTARVLWDLLHL